MGISEILDISRYRTSIQSMVNGNRNRQRVNHPHPHTRVFSQRPDLVALDIDGTLVGHTGEVTSRVQAAVVNAERCGAYIALTTGRSLMETQPIIEALGLSRGFAICSNGAVIAQFRPTEIIAVRTFDAAPAVHALLSIIPTAILAVEDLNAGYRVTAEFPPGELHAPQKKHSLDELFQEPVPRVIVRDVGGNVDELVSLTRRLSLTGVSYSVGFKAWLDLGPANVSKGSSLSQVARQLDIPSSSCLAIGDGRNDLEMLTWVGRGVAMGQAPDEVKSIADAITENVERDGVAHELERWFGVRSMLPGGYRGDCLTDFRLQYH